jgi:hypothetical protein
MDSKKYPADQGHDEKTHPEPKERGKDHRFKNLAQAVELDHRRTDEPTDQRVRGTGRQSKT